MGMLHVGCVLEDIVPYGCPCCDDVVEFYFERQEASQRLEKKNKIVFDPLLAQCLGSIFI